MYNRWNHGVNGFCRLEAWDRAWHGVEAVNLNDFEDSREGILVVWGSCFCFCDRDVLLSDVECLCSTRTPRTKLLSTNLSMPK